MGILLEGELPLRKEMLLLSPSDIICNLILYIGLLLWNLVCFIGGAKTNILHDNIDDVFWKSNGIIQISNISYPSLAEMRKIWFLDLRKVHSEDVMPVC